MDPLLLSNWGASTENHGGSKHTITGNGWILGRGRNSEVGFWNLVTLVDTNLR
jgi:hypothetical protein